MENLSFDQIWGSIAVFVLLLGAYNVIMAAIKNSRDERREKRKPVSELELKVKDLENRVGTLAAKVENIEKDSEDLHKGLMAVCEGIQAQLNHSLNNGNEDEMRGALTTINKWLRSR